MAQARDDQRHRHRQNNVEDRMIFAARPFQNHGLVGHEYPVEAHGLRAGRPHTHGRPIVQEGHALGIGRHREMQHLRPFSRVVIGRRCHEGRTGGRAAGEGFERRHLVAALDLFGIAVRFEPVIGPGRDQRPPGAVIDHRRRDQMRMHRQRKRGRTAGMGQATDKLAELAIAGAAAAQLRRYQGREHLVGLQLGVVFSNEAIRCVQFRDPPGKSGA
jgi:hypothetical protein